MTGKEWTHIVSQTPFDGADGSSTFGDTSQKFDAGSYGKFNGHIDEVRVTTNWARYGRTGKARMGRIAKGWKGVWVALKAAITGKPVPMEWQDFTLEAWIKPRSPDGVIDEACLRAAKDGFIHLTEVREQWLRKADGVSEIKSESRTVYCDGVFASKTTKVPAPATKGETP